MSDVSRRGVLALGLVGGVAALAACGSSGGGTDSSSGSGATSGGGTGSAAGTGSGGTKGSSQ